MKPVDYWIKHLNLQKLEPEGGYFRQIYNSTITLQGSSLPQGFISDRSLASSIYYLLTTADHSHFHRLKSDEIWSFHYGSAITLHQIDINGNYVPLKVGMDPALHEPPQTVVKAGTIFGATVNEPDSYALVGCVVTPGFTFDDFELISRNELLHSYPEHREIIMKLTRE